MTKSRYGANEYRTPYQRYGSDQKVDNEFSDLTKIIKNRDITRGIKEQAVADFNAAHEGNYKVTMGLSIHNKYEYFSVKLICVKTNSELQSLITPMSSVPAIQPSTCGFFSKRMLYVAGVGAGTALAVGCVYAARKYF